MRRSLRVCLALLLLGITAASTRIHAQAIQGLVPPPPPQQTSGYPVVGRVICADTQRPARFAQVTLIPASNTVSEYDRGRRAVGRTDLDGHFTIDNVPPGDYFATAEMTGYINDLPAVQLAIGQGGDALNTISSVPRIQVTAGGASAQLSLQRGAVLTGTVQWDDGSPAAGVQVSAQPASTTGAQGTAPSQLQQGFGRPQAFAPYSGGQTDDRGRFRLSGLSAGAYVLRANVQSPTPGSTPGNGRFPRLMSVSVYAPNKLRKTEGTVITLAAGEEHGDVNIVLALAGMHTVSGNVSSPSAAVRSGSVLLTDQTDSSLNRRSDINADGSFTIPYVPSGTYSLRVTASSQLPPNLHGGNNESDASVRFDPMQESVTVTDGDLTGIAVTVTPATTASSQ